MPRTEARSLRLFATRRPPRPARCPRAVALRGSGSGLRRRTRCARASASVGPVAVTPSSRPPFVTSRPSLSAVPAWKTSAPDASASPTPSIGRAAIAGMAGYRPPRRRPSPPPPRAAEVGVRRVTPCGGRRSAARRSPSTSGSTDCVSGSPNRQLYSSTRGPSARQHQADEQRADERRSPVGELREDRSDARPRPARLLPRSSSSATGANDPIPPVLGPSSPSNARL